MNWTSTSNSVMFNETYPWFLPFTHTKSLLSFINSSSMISVLSLKVSPKLGDDIAGAPISIPTNSLYLSYKFENQELCESPANIKLDSEFDIFL